MVLWPPTLMLTWVTTGSHNHKDLCNLGTSQTSSKAGSGEGQDLSLPLWSTGVFQMMESLVGEV